MWGDSDDNDSNDGGSDKHAAVDEFEIPEPDTVDLDTDGIDHDTTDSGETKDSSFLVSGALGALGLLKPLPFSWKIYHKINRWSAYKMQRASGADAIANVRRSSGREDMLPASVVDGSEDGKELGGWKVLGLGNKRYATGVMGGQSNRYGKADLIHINEDDLEQGSWAEAAVDRAIAAGREQYLFRNAELDVVVDVTGVDNPESLEYPGRRVQVDGDDSGEETAADGGYVQQVTDVDIRRPGVLEDALVPLNSRTGYDGQLISWNSYQNLKAEQADQDQLRDAKNSAWVAAKLDDVSERDLFKLALIGAAILAMALFHGDIGAAISSFGSGGGGGGGGAAVPGLGFVLPMMPKLWGQK